MEILDTLSQTIKNLTDPESGLKLDVRASLADKDYLKLSGVIVGSILIGGLVNQLIKTVFN